MALRTKRIGWEYRFFSYPLVKGLLCLQNLFGRTRHALVDSAAWLWFHLGRLKANMGMNESKECLHMITGWSVELKYRSIYLTLFHILYIRTSILYSIILYIHRILSINSFFRTFIPTFNTAILPRNSLRWTGGQPMSSCLAQTGAARQGNDTFVVPSSSRPSVACSTSLFDLLSKCQETSGTQGGNDHSQVYSTGGTGVWWSTFWERKGDSWAKLVCIDVVPDHDSRRGRNQCGALHLSATLMKVLSSRCDPKAAPVNYPWCRAAEMPFLQRPRGWCLREFAGLSYGDPSRFKF